MFKTIFRSLAIPYTLWDGVTVTPYNGYLTTPPRLYVEEVNFPLGLFVSNVATAASATTITLLLVMTCIAYPGYSYEVFKVDTVTGGIVSRAPLGGDLYTGVLHVQNITQGFDGSIWASDNLGGISEYDPVSYALMQTIDGSHFGRTGMNMPLVDKGRDVVIMPIDSPSQPQIWVYRLSSGALIRTINTSGAPVNMCAEDARRLYVLCDNNMLDLIDYTTGETISAYKCPIPAGTISSKMGFDQQLRRLLVFAQVAAAADGSDQSTVLGFYPVPLATHLLTPIPLRPPRRGRQIPVLLRAVGDSGEPLAGVLPQASATGDASLARAPSVTDSNGESIAYLLCDAAGSVALSVTANIDD